MHRNLRSRAWADLFGRLESQHGLFVAIAGGLIHESIPRSEIKRVADVAVGTGYIITRYILLWIPLLFVHTLTIFD